MDIGGEFQIRNARRGLKEPKIAAAMVKLTRMASNDWRKLIFSPSNGASIPLRRALPKVVSRMINGKRIVVVLPAYNAEKTLEATVRELPEIVDEGVTGFCVYLQVYKDLISRRAAVSETRRRS